MILDVLNQYPGAFTYHELWAETPASEVSELHDEAARHAKRDQEIPVFQAWMLARNPYVGGMKDLELDDLYSGLARKHIAPDPYSQRVMRGIQLAAKLHAQTKRLYLSQAHVDLLDAKALARWFKRKGG